MNNDSEKEKQELIQEILERMKYLESTDEIPDDKKVAIARNALNILDSAAEAKELNEVVQ